MNCPKCGHVQEDTVACQSCGLVFEKYRQYLQRQAAQREPVAPLLPRPRSRMPLLIFVMLLLAGVAGGGYYFGIAKAHQAGSPLAKPTAQASVRPEVVEGHDIVALLTKNAPAGNPVESARNATVFIKTPWGLGSGFFVKDDCTIITNRHVVQLDEKDRDAIIARIREVKEEAASLEAVVGNDRAKLQKYYERNSGPAAERKARDFEEELEQKEAVLEEMKADIAKAEMAFGRKSGRLSLKIIVADGSEYSGFVYNVSSVDDLAVVKLDADGYCPVLPTGSSTALHQGDRLYTVGSPMGVRHTVTSGIYSGQLEIKGVSMLQTDAPINPGNSGGPLINEEGKVLGVNTMVLDNAQGIGFAIPIEQAMKMFSSI